MTRAETMHCEGWRQMGQVAGEEKAASFFLSKLRRKQNPRTVDNRTGLPKPTTANLRFRQERAPEPSGQPSLQPETGSGYSNLSALRDLEATSSEIGGSGLRHLHLHASGLPGCRTLRMGSASSP